MRAQTGGIGFLSYRLVGFAAILIQTLIFVLISSAGVAAAAIAGSCSEEITGTARHRDGILHSKPGNPSIQWCIDHASDGDTILVYPGTYYEHLDFLGKAIVVKGVAGAAETVVDAGGRGSVVTFLSGEDTTSVLEGLTLRNGGGTLLPPYRGGGIYANEASLKVTDCIIKDNSVGSINQGGLGGGFRISYGSLIMRNCIVRNNESGSGGGGSLGFASGIVSGCRFEGNVAFGEKDRSEYTGGDAGALKLYACDGLFVSGNEFSNNMAPLAEEGYHSCGGAIQIRYGSPEIRNNLFMRNEAGCGGAIAVILECNSLIYGNLFLYNRAGDPWYSGNGGAVYCFDGDAFARTYNNTFFGNGAYPGEWGDVKGGAVCHWRPGGGVINNIFLNTLSGRALTYGVGVTHHHNCFWNNADGDVYSPGIGTIFEDPLTDPDKSFMLPGESPCIDAGAETAVPDEEFCGENPDMGAREHCGWAPSRPGFIVLDPVAYLSTDSLGGVALKGGESESDRFRLVNKGVHTLDYEVKHDGAPWYSLDGVLEGELGWNEDEYIHCFFDCAGLSPGRYIDTLTVESNDPENPELLIEVELSIYTHGVIHVPGYFNAIRLAVDAAVDGDTILVAPGTYTGPFNRDTDPHGKRLAILSFAGWDSTIIDCEGKGRAFHYNTGEDLQSILSGFTVTGGSTDSYGKEYGGGVYASKAAPVIEFCRFKDNYARLNGGGVLISMPNDLIITQCIFDHNNSGGGDGLYVNGYYSEVNIQNCLFYANQGSGACLKFNLSGILENNIFWQNTGEQLDIFSVELDIRYNNLAGNWPGQGNIDEDPLLIDPDNGNFRLFEASPCIDAANPETPNVPWGGSRRDMGAFEFDKGWYLDNSGNIVRKPVVTVFGITTFLDDPPACIEPGCPVSLGSAVQNNDITEGSFDQLLFILTGSESDTCTISDTLVTLAPGGLILYPFTYEVPPAFSHCRATARIEASLAGDLLHVTENHTKVSICSHKADSLDD